ncbi:MULTISPECIES: hypothetical protein [unclassified Mesorhizobium]|uniref:hypothetical protein n=1 Tax=unclassified Mesorhizobium TaxID=325217 RepID=UPI0010930EB1|nr:MULTISPECIES: hypothetical protein [unclassified Mesorhizobium]TGP95509.1 hypothetical protein EN861_11445 [Mesorhizobium sp. M8A.F.Ca.ET.218.01.1.1]TGT18563.1 hypothetical protein EN856_11460 [Mesorhizobium sp. M8A.F.Ca.ET.213.01.1.1]TGT89574.1 hypothetical protein EN804_11820 [Mesorhizobium sp. M8A.F.Ca.ET.161.01.1.1]TGV42132.1 hypothetical protein EN785_11810 [Mesorhizobium sp. M8A.F.Ca.ET.142.01.1.1]
MSWREDMISRLKDEIEYLQATIRIMHADTATIGNASPSGRLTSLNDDAIAHYERTIEALQKIVTSLEAKDY